MILLKLSILAVCLCTLVSGGFVRIKNTQKEEKKETQEKETNREEKKFLSLIFSPEEEKYDDRYEDDKYAYYEPEPYYHHPVKPAAPFGAELYKSKVKDFEDKLNTVKMEQYKGLSDGQNSVVLVGLQKPSFGVLGNGMGAALQGIRYGLSGAAALVGGKVGALAGSVAGTVKGAVIGAAKGAAVGAATGAGLAMSGGDRTKYQSIDYRPQQPASHQGYRPYPYVGIRKDW